MKYSVKNDIADPILYRVYWRLCLEDILFHLGNEIKVKIPPTKENKEYLHQFHKRVLGYTSTAGRSQEVVSRFLQDVCIFWAELGIFVRTSKKQPLWIELRGFSDKVKVGDEFKTVWELL